MKPEENYVKSIKNWIIVISSVVFLINIWELSKVNGILLSSFTYLASTGLNFYSFSPNNRSSKIRRKLLIKLSISSVGVTFVSEIVAVHFPLIVDIVLLLSVKILFTIFGVFSVFSTFMDDSETITKEEKRASYDTNQGVRVQGYNKAKVKKAKENTKIKQFITNKKSNK